MTALMERAADSNNASELAAKPPWRAWVIIAIPVVFAALLMGHVRGVNGPEYWTWHYRRLPVWPLLGMMIVAAIPFFAGNFLYARKMVSPIVALVLFGATTIGLRYAATINIVSPPSFDAVEKVIAHRVAYSYYYDALRVSRDVNRGRLTWTAFLQRFPSLMPNLGTHTRIRPPGGILLHAGLINVVGEQSAPAVVGVIVALCAALSVLAVYWMLRVFEFATDEAMAAAGLIALFPGFVLFFPALDPIYVGLAAVLIVTWELALRAQGRAAAMARGIICGVVLSVISFITYNLMVLGIFLALLAMLRLNRKLWSFSTTFVVCVTLIGTVVALYCALWWITGFDAVATLGSALANQHREAMVLGRQHLHTQFWDLYDFSLASAHVGIPLAVLGLGAARTRKLAVVALGTILLIDVTALLPVETARVWLFLLSVLAIPIAAELGRWSHRQRAALFAGVWLVTLVACMNLWMMTFSEQLLPPWARSQRLTGPHARVILPPPGADR